MWNLYHINMRYADHGAGLPRANISRASRRRRRVLLAVPGVESAVVDLQSGSAMVVSAAVPAATLLAAVEATGKGCRVEGERRSITSIARSAKPTQGDAEFLLLASASDCCGR